MKTQKKCVLLKTLIPASLGILSIGLVAPTITGCSKSSNNIVELSERVEISGISIKSSNVTKGIATIEFNLPESKPIETILIRIGDNYFTQKSANVSINDNIVKIDTKDANVKKIIIVHVGFEKIINVKLDKSSSSSLKYTGCSIGDTQTVVGYYFESGKVKENVSVTINGNTYTKETTPSIDYHTEDLTVGGSELVITIDNTLIGDSNDMVIHAEMLKNVNIVVDGSTLPEGFVVPTLSETLGEGETLSVPLRAGSVYHTNLILTKSDGTAVASSEDYSYTDSESAAANPAEVTIDDWDSIEDGETLTLSFETNKISSIKYDNNLSDVFHVSDTFDIKKLNPVAIAENTEQYNIANLVTTDIDGTIYTSAGNYDSPTMSFHGLTYKMKKPKITIQDKIVNLSCTSKPEELEITFSEAKLTTNSESTTTITIKNNGSSEFNGSLYLYVMDEFEEEVVITKESKALSVAAGNESLINLTPSDINWTIFEHNATAYVCIAQNA